MKTLKRILLFIGLKIAEIIGLCFGFVVIAQIGALCLYWVPIIEVDQIYHFYESNFWTYDYFYECICGSFCLAGFIVILGGLILYGVGWLIYAIVMDNWNRVKRIIK